MLVYDTQDEDSIYGLVDSLIAQPGIQSVISYPTLMSRPLTPVEMSAHVSSLLIDFKDYMPEGATVPPEALDAINPEMISLLYYMRAKTDMNPRMSFPDLARFLHTHVASNPLFASYIDPGMRTQIADLQSMLDVPAPVVEEEEPTPAPVVEEPLPAEQPEEAEEDTNFVIQRETIAPITHKASPIALQKDSLAIPEMEIDKVALIPFITRLNAMQTSAISVEMRKLTDTAAPMSIKEMSNFMGSTPTQTTLVYGYAPGAAKKLTPLQYVHLLVDDLFKRPGLAGMVSDEQRTLLSQRAYLMDLANMNASLTPKDLNILLRAFGIDRFSDEELLAFANPPKQQPHPKKATSPSDLDAEEIVNAIAQIQQSLHSTDTTRADVVENAEVVVPKPVKKGPSREDMQAELFTELVFGGKTYTADKMASKLAHLMRLSNVKSAPVTPAQMSLLYDYYGSVHSGCDTLRVGFAPLLVYLCDTLVHDPRLQEILPDSVRSGAANIKSQMKDGLGQLRKERHSLLVVLSTLPKESPETYAFVDILTALADARMPHEHYYVGESVMYAEMRGGFDHEMNVVTLLTILAIFLIVALTFRSVIVPTILVLTVMTAVFMNVVVAGLVTGKMLYLAYLIAQAILMGATIDYGILFANYYRENRKVMLPVDAVCAAYRGSIRTILTSGLIMVIGPGAMALFVDDLMISNIVGCIAVGAFAAIVLTLTVVPAVLVALDRWVVYGKQNRFTGEQNDQQPITNDK